jgi:hypothetical protein
LTLQNAAGCHLSSLFPFLLQTTNKTQMTMDCRSSNGFGAGEVIAIVVGIITLYGVIVATLAWWEQRKAKSSPPNVEPTPEQLEIHQALEEAVQDLKRQQKLANRLAAALGMAWLRSDPNYRFSIPEESQELIFQIIGEID